MATSTKSSLKERLDKKRKEIAERSAGGKFLTIKEGKMRIRHLPVGEEKEFCIEAIYFYLGDKLKGFISPKSIGKKCAVHDAYTKLAASKDAADRELAGKFKPARRYFSPVVQFKDEKDSKSYDVEKGVKMLALTPGLYRNVLDLYLEPEQGDMTDAENGYDLKYSRTGKGKMDTEYTVIACKPTPLAKTFAKKAPYDIDALFAEMLPTYEESKKIIDEFLSLPPEEEDDAPVKKKKKKKKTRDI